MKKEEALKLVATSIKKTKNQKNGQNPIIGIVSIKTIARLWAGMGCCNEFQSCMEAYKKVIFLMV